MNVTLKEFPTELHSRLKDIAEISGRSLNKQIIYLLEKSTAPQKTDDADLLRRIRANRESLNVTVTPESLEQAIAEGRA